MPNQLNFPDPIQSTKYQRPARVSAQDRAIIKTVDHQVLFGTDARDVVELYAYNADGSIEGAISVRPTDPALSLTTLIDQSGPTELLNLNIVELANRMGLQPGRYALAAHFFRDEVGSEQGYKLFISEISPDRTEVRLEPVEPNPTALRDVYEFVEPSVPKLFAQGLIDQVFGKSLDVTPAEVISTDKIVPVMEELRSGMAARINHAGLAGILGGMVDTIVQRTHVRTLNLIANDVRNLNIQQVELQEYVFTALDEVLHEMHQKGEIPPHFRLV